MFLEHLPVYKDTPNFRKWLESFVSDDKNGSILYIDIAVAPTKELFQALGFAITQHFGRRYFVAFRSKNKEKLHRFRKAEQALFKLK